MRDELAVKINRVIEVSKNDHRRLQGQKRKLREALYKIRKLNKVSIDYAMADEVEEIIRAVLVLTFG